MFQKHCFRAGGAALWLALAGFAAAQNPPVAIGIDANANRRAISSFIYGVAGASAAELADLNAPLNRYGGNNATRYNWQQNADNRGFDWYFESIAEDSATPGERGDRLIAADRGAGAESMITLPIIDWVAKAGPGRAKLAGFSQAKYGAQTDADWSWFPDAGNGILASTGQPVAGNDPNDANVPNGVALQQAWVQHLVGRWGPANSGGLKYYVLDNEHSIWFSTHRDVQPVGPTMEQIRQKMIDYAAAIKAVDPAAQIVGPEEWGWSGYLLSGYDQQWGAQHGWGSLPDRAAHGNMDYLPWLLGQLRQHDLATGAKSLDVFSVHYYPQGGEFGDSVTPAMQQRRNRSTRSLWDPGYVDETWINDAVMLLPRLKNWVAARYPGLKTAVTEYNWGAENHINGATAQADVLGIFGREGLDYAARWTTPAASTPTYKAMKLYRNYDGGKSGFGDISVGATVPDPDALSAFAAVRSADGALTVMVVNKALTGTTPVSLSLANFSPGGVAQVWQLASANAIARLADVAVAGAALGTALPAQSVTLFVLPVAAATLPGAPAIGTAVAGNHTLSIGFSPGPLNGGTLLYHQANCMGALASGAAAPLQLTDLCNGCLYRCRVRTVTNVGAGPWSADSNAVVPTVSLAEAPVIGTATAASQSISLSFTPGALNGGTLLRYEANCLGALASGSGSPIVLTNLHNGSLYTCKVRAVTDAGAGPWSAASNAVVPTTSLPAAPAIGTAVAGNRTLSLGFTPGALNGGALLQYEANCMGAVASGTASPIVFSGLHNGSLYSCKVRAVTSIGAGPWSGSSNAVVPNP